MSDVTQLQGTVGQATASSGESRAVTLTPRVALRTANTQGSFQDAVERGNVYGVCNQTGITSQAGLSATTPALTLYNPLASGKNLVVWYVGASFTVAFATAGAVWVALNSNTAAAAVTGTLTTAHRNLKVGTANSNAGQALLAATLPAAPVGVALLGSGLTGAITTTPVTQTLERWFNGSLILIPGTALSVQTGVASGASGTFLEYIWEEVTA